MKVRTSVTLSEDVVAAVDDLAGKSGNRSEVIETALRSYLAQMNRDKQNRRDLGIINRRAVRLNREAEDVLAFQGEL
jgi:metal-responsive CopG/Arc/MetJ family transcriptional regulator